MMISDKKRLIISNICYANVAGEFALFINPYYRGPAFTWNWFITHCEGNADLWLLLHDIHNKTMIKLARELAVEIAKNLVGKAGFEFEHVS
jgi:hypothetical protein